MQSSSGLSKTPARICRLKCYEERCGVSSTVVVSESPVHWYHPSHATAGSVHYYGLGSCHPWTNLSLGKGLSKHGQ